MELLKEPFSMFSDFIKKEDNNKLTDKTKTRILDYKEKFKDMYFELSDKYVPFCLQIDKEFEEFLSKYE
ncbi:hypothetical protein MWU76_05760 [Gelidibacter sp. F2691]|nr:hypothetical protein [Gelidibacter sp. F2691]